MRMLQQVGLTNYLIKETNVSIHGFDGKGGKAIGKIMIRCQIGDMHSKLTCYIIEAARAYNLLLGRPWTHESCVVPSTLHQCFGYVGEDLRVHRQFADKNPFHCLEAQYTDAALYAPNEAGRPREGKETMAVISAGGMIHAKEESPMRIMGSGRITEGIDEALRKFNRNFGRIAHAASLNMRLKSSMQPHLQYDQKLKEVMRQTGCGQVEPIKRTYKGNLMIIAK